MQSIALGHEPKACFLFVLKGVWHGYNDYNIGMVSTKLTLSPGENLIKKETKSIYLLSLSMLLQALSCTFENSFEVDSLSTLRETLG